MADPAAPPELAEELVIELPRPIEHDGQSWGRLVLREPLVGEVRVFDRLDGATSVIVGAALIAGVPEAVIRKMGASRLKKAERYLRAFIDWSPKPYKPGELPEELVLTLRKPVTFAGEPIDKLQLREPTSGELEVFSRKDGIEAAIAAVQIVAAVPEKVIDQIGIRDLNTGADYLMGFLA